MKWSIKLTQYGILFKSWPAIKGQAIADYIVEFMYRPIEYQMWEMHMDGVANHRVKPSREAGARITFSGPDNYKVKFTIKFSFHASNKEADYEAMTHSLEIAKDLEIKKLKVYSDSQLIINQMTNEFQEKGKKMSL